MRFLTVSGSLRASSSNTALLEAAGAVVPAGIALERRRTEHDLEVRRLRLVELARNQIEAVQPLLNSPSADGVLTRCVTIAASC